MPGASQFLTFSPTLPCSWCDRLTHVALLNPAWADKFTPICPEHGYADGIPELELASIKRFLVWSNGGGANVRVHVIGECKLGEVPGYIAGEPDLLGFDDRAWKCRYRAHRRSIWHLVYVVWSFQEGRFSSYQPS